MIDRITQLARRFLRQYQQDMNTDIHSFGARFEDYSRGIEDDARYDDYEAAKRQLLWDIQSQTHSEKP